MSGVRLERPPVPGTIPFYSKVLVLIDGRERPAQVGAAIARNDAAQLFVTFTDSVGGSGWVPRTSVRLAPEPLWRRAWRWLRGLLDA